MDKTELWLLGVLEGLLGFSEWMDEWLCWCLGDQRICRGLRMHKLLQCEKTHQRQMVRTRVCASKMLQRPVWTQWHISWEGTKPFTGDQEGFVMPWSCCHVIISTPSSPSLERAKEEKGSWKDSTFIQKKMHHRRVHLKEKRQYNT